ncbi:MAG: hypothetical protein IJA55_07110 [Clostridia bacterium]|nr:hypothetical protein [Clostridia bacterium]
MKRSISFILCAVMFISAFSFNIFAFPVEVRVADPHTLDDWQHLFGDEVNHTGNAGAVWSDKSVLTDPSVLGFELTDPSNFAVALSALASDMNIVGYSGVPVDTMLIIESDNTQVCADYIERAAKEIFASNNHSRVGAVIYSEKDSYILPVGKYSAGISSSLKKTEKCQSFQQAMYKAYELFMEIEDTAIEGEGIQSGTKRLPICLLMTKGKFSEASSNFADMSVNDLTTESEEYAYLVPFAMQLTAAYAKASVEKHYDHEMLVYTLGSVSELLDTDATVECWDVYEAAPAGSSVQFASGKDWIRDNGGYWQTLYKSFKKTSLTLSRDFVTEYYTSETHFDTVIDKIIEHSLHNPTYVEGIDGRMGGYIEFIDDIGRYMEVKEIKGISLAGALYSGEALALNFVPGGGELGTVVSPNDLGNEMIWAVMERLGIDSLATAQQLVSLAYRSGQLSYNTETGEYSNYIGWYADDNGCFISHAKDSDTVIPEEAVYYNKSYGFTGGVADGYEVADMMYVSVQVHTNIITGDQAVIFRVPAALIPVIMYNVSFTGKSLDDPGEITLERDDRIMVDTAGDGKVDEEVAITPIRLIYEVGVRSEIDDITVHSIVDEDYEYVENGVYTFYTNRWNMDDIGHSNPSQAKNTVSFFSPSPENERYYYTQNTTVYELKNGEYVPYKGVTAPSYESGRFFRNHNVYEYANSSGGGNAIMHTHYEEMSAGTLSNAKRSDSGNWYIPKGTVYRYFEDHEHLKSANITGTVPYSHYVNIESIDDAETKGYYVDYILGNNGKMTLNAAEGIRLSVTTDETMKGRTDKVFFEITAPDGNYRMVSYGNTRTEQIIGVSGGKAIVEIAQNSETYIVDLPVGSKVNIKMLTEGRDYNSKDADDVTFTVEESKLLDAEFVTTLTPPEDSGTMVLSCDVVHPLGDDADPTYHTFSFEIRYGDKSEVHNLRHGESTVIRDIPIGVAVTVSELGLTEGFTSDKIDDKLTFTVDGAGIFLANFVNTYSPNKADMSNVTLTGDIELTGRALLSSDNFKYKLQHYSGRIWADMAEASATKDEPCFDFTSFISGESFKASGVYSYRIIPVIDENPHNGITYDKMVRWFEVIVTDNDWDGNYEVSSIVGLNGTIVAKNNNKWDIHASFFSKYKATGNDAVSIIVNTVIDGNGKLPAKGYVYGLYQNGILLQEFPVSDTNGESVITLSYSAADIGNSIDYTVKQIIPDTPSSEIKYSDKEYKLTVNVEDDLMGNVKASITAEGKTEREIHLTFINAYIADFPDAVTTDSESGTVTDKETDKPVKDTTTVNKDTTSARVPPSDSPMTGDRGIIFSCVLLIASVSIIIITICTKKKKTVS